MQTVPELLRRCAQAHSLGAAMHAGGAVSAGTELLARLVLLADRVGADQPA